MLALALTPDGRLAGSGLIDDPRLERALGILNPAGEETRLVGGAVRNALLGLPPGDVDVATTMLPADVMRRAKAARIRAIPTGIDHGTVTLMIEGLPVEVTTLREDIETDGRHAVVRFGRDFALDAQRRDFTMNALSVDAGGRVFDTVGGVTDLSGGHVRFIGDAATRIREDYLRILRFFRFHATYGQGPLDPDGLAASIANRRGIERLSRERLRAELFKILGAPGAGGAIRVMAEGGILDLILGPGTKPAALAALTALDGETPDPLIRLAAIAAVERADVTRLRQALRLSNGETARLEAALEAAADLSGPPDPPHLRRLVFDHGPQAATDALRLAAASGAQPPDLWRRSLAEVATLPRLTLPFTGTDLLARGLTGPAVGAALALLRTRWAEAGFPDDPDARARLLDAVASASGPHPAG